MKEIALYGGTFSPPHNGHLLAATEMFRSLDPWMMFIIPAALPPHKQLGKEDNPLHRLEMTRLAFADHPEYGHRLKVSDYEIQKEGTSYTWQTLEHFASLYPANEGYRLNFLCGTDMFLTLANWKHPEVIFSLARILLFRLENHPELAAQIAEREEFYRRTWAGNCLVLDGTPLELSSTEIRQNLVNHSPDTAKLLPPAVLNYIHSNHLYETGIS